eukprot:symbB.v1.2.037414.t1/scaffold5518.1/size26226/3
MFGTSFWSLVKVEYEMSQLQEGNSHFSIETRWTLPSNVLSLLCFISFCGLFAKRCLTELSSVGRLHTVIWALAAVIAMQLLAQLLHALHLYSYNGSGVKFCEVVAEIMFIVSQLVQSTLLILIGYGYTLVPVDVEPSTVLLIFVASALLHIVLVLLTKAEDSADKFHDYDGLAGKLLLGFRLAAYAVFLFCLKGTMGVWFHWHVVLCGASFASAAGSGIRTVLASSCPEHKLDASADWHNLVVAQSLPVPRRVFQGLRAQCFKPSGRNTALTSRLALLTEERLVSSE